MKKFLIVSLIIIIGLVLYFVLSYKEDSINVYESENDKQVAQLIENSITQAYLSSQPNFNTISNKIVLELSLKDIKGIGFTGGYGLNNTTLKLMNIKWDKEKQWQNSMPLKDFSHGHISQLFLLKNDLNIIPIKMNLYNYEFSEDYFFGDNSKFNLQSCLTKQTSSFCELKNGKLKIKITTNKIAKKAFIEIEDY